MGFNSAFKGLKNRTQNLQSRYLARDKTGVKGRWERRSKQLLDDPKKARR